MDDLQEVGSGQAMRAVVPFEHLWSWAKGLAPRRKAASGDGSLRRKHFRSPSRRDTYSALWLEHRSTTGTRSRWTLGT